MKQIKTKLQNNNKYKTRKHIKMNKKREVKKDIKKNTKKLIKNKSLKKGGKKCPRKVIDRLKKEIYMGFITRLIGDNMKTVIEIMDKKCNLGVRLVYDEELKKEKLPVKNMVEDKRLPRRRLNLDTIIKNKYTVKDEFKERLRNTLRAEKSDRDDDGYHWVYYDDEGIQWNPYNLDRQKPYGHQFCQNHALYLAFHEEARDAENLVEVRRLLGNIKNSDEEEEIQEDRRIISYRELLDFWDKNLLKIIRNKKIQTNMFGLFEKLLEDNNEDNEKYHECAFIIIEKLETLNNKKRYNDLFEELMSILADEDNILYYSNLSGLDS